MIIIIVKVLPPSTTKSNAQHKNGCRSNIAIIPQSMKRSLKKKRQQNHRDTQQHVIPIRIAPTSDLPHQRSPNIPYQNHVRDDHEPKEHE
mmetsp:Transcript_4188/g.6325  ORF Transcript_4188/g.6325 Transcript_4188/m.6325 type:complete len:90 (-) Transcript_4188:74-343(-)